MRVLIALLIATAVLSACEQSESEPSNLQTALVESGLATEQAIATTSVGIPIDLNIVTPLVMMATLDIAEETALAIRNLRCELAVDGIALPTAGYAEGCGPESGPPYGGTPRHPGGLSSIAQLVERGILTSSHADSLSTRVVQDRS